MNTTSAIGWQIVLRLEDDRALAPDAPARRALVRAVTTMGQDHGLLAFGAADTHLHGLALCDRPDAGLLARSLEVALVPRLGAPVRFSSPTITRINDQDHLRAAFGYVQRNARKHGIADPHATESSSLHDHLGLRVIAPWLAERARRALPRTTRTDLLATLALPNLCTTGEPDIGLPDALAAAFALPDVFGASCEASRARAAGVALLMGRWTTASIAEVLRVTPRSVPRLAALPPCQADLAALQRQLAWRAAIKGQPRGY